MKIDFEGDNADRENKKSEDFCLLADIDFHSTKQIIMIVKIVGFFFSSKHRIPYLVLSGVRGDWCFRFSGVNENCVHLVFW